MPSQAPISLQELRQVCQAACTLFGPQEAACRGFWAGLSLSRVKRVFREQARRCHPDNWPQAPPHRLRETQDHFVAIKRSYDLLRDFLTQHPGPAAAAPGVCRPRIIAIGGPKGGVGKSVVAANLGVLLARQGHRVVLADLDPTGPTLPLYLGNAGSQRPLFREGAFLTGLVSPTRFGPEVWCAAGLDLSDSAAGQSQRCHFYQDLRGLPADYVFCDLGSGAQPGTLDFFLRADRQMVVTTCDPAAYVKAYDFLKAARCRQLEQLICPTSPPKKLAPLLLINQAADRDPVRAVARRLQKVAGDLLGVTLQYATLPYREEIAQSVRDLVPAATRNISGLLAQRLAHLARVLAA